MTTPPPPAEIHELGAAQLCAAYRSGELAPSAVLEHTLDRIAAVNPRLNSIIVTLSERARAAAAESDRRWAAGDPRPLEGVPFGAKDVMNVAGTATTVGSALYLDAVADDDAEVIRRAEGAGAILVAKEATTEFAIGGPHNPTFGAVRNPWDTARWTGGSSAGAGASLGGRLFPLSIGSDAGGSIRMPASWCGVTGLKPTIGAVPRTGVFPLSWTTETVGPMGRSAVDVASLFGVLRGRDPRDPRSVDPPGDTLAEIAAGRVSTDLSGTRIGVPSGYLLEVCDAEVRANFDEAVRTLVGLGADRVDVEVAAAHDSMEMGYHVLFTEAASTHQANGAGLDRCDPIMVRRLSQGMLTPAVDYLAALQFRVRLQRDLAAAFESVDVIATPTTPCTAPSLNALTVRIDGAEVPMYSAQSRALMLCNLSGAPAVAFPSGFDHSGCPTSVQLIAPPHGETVALCIAAAYQEMTDHHQASPTDC